VIGAVVALGAVATALVLVDRGGVPRILDTSGCTAEVDGHTVEVDLEQAENASLITAISAQRGMPARAASIALATAYQESKLYNIEYGDRDSVGLFQQRPSQGWGTPQQVMDPQYAAAAFFVSLRDLGDKRFGMGMGEAAQAVQRSAYPDRYAERIRDMRRMWPQIQGAAGERPQTVEGEDYLDTNPLVGNQISGEEYAAQGSGARVVDATPEGQTPGPGVQGRALTPLETEPVTPTAEQMLGAWGMSNPAVQQPEIDFDPIQAGPLTSPATNASVIPQLQEEVGDFAPGVDGWRKAVIAAARSALGTPYTWGGNSLQGGVDCSGLIQQAFAQAGITMPRVSYMQANRGARVGIDALRPGDLVAWDNSSRNNGADHIAIYLGGGQIIEAPRPGSVVRVRSIEGDEGAWGVRLSF
jgi:cell wall-associated NlpC family hydrolase